ncbi:MAG: hypothetical protein LBE78_08990 [Burkholderiaceae bacterium]|nr:hypothetical protein [Burkholderiaceae bacterium]
MNFNKIRFLSAVILSAGIISSCATPLEKSEIADYEALKKAIKNRPYIISGEYRLCCMDIMIIEQQAKDIFDKMPDNTLLTVPTEGTCLAGRVVKISEGTMCTTAEFDTNDPTLYQCSVTINYSTGTTEKVNINDYLKCDDEGDDEGE